jgi:hypothetical protein
MNTTTPNLNSQQRSVKALIVLLAFVLSSMVQAMSLNRFQIPLLQNPEQRLYTTSDDRLLYSAPIDETTTAVFALDLHSMQSTSLLTVPTTSLVGTNLSFNELSPDLLFLFLPVSASDGFNRIYVSRLGQPFEPYLDQSADDLTPDGEHHKLLATHVNGQNLITNGDPATQVLIDGQYNVLCPLSLNHVVVYKRVGNDKILYQYLNGEFEPLLPQYEPTFAATSGDTVVIEGACVIPVNNLYTDEESFYYHPVAGEPAFLPDSVVQVRGTDRDLVVLNKRTSALLPRTLQLLNGQTLEVLNERSVSQQSSNGLILNTMSVKNNRVFFYNDYVPTATELLILDSELNAIHSAISVTGYHRLISTPELDILAYRDRLEIYRLGEWLNSIPLSENVELGYHYSNSQLIANTFDFLGNYFDGTQFYKLDPQPAAGSAVQGPWVDTQYKNQGLSIHHGIRQDDSEYIYATLYLFRDGAPFWLAGATDVNAGQPVVDMELFEFDGANFLDSEAPERIPFGFMNLRFTACDRMQATVRYGTSQTSLDLRRVDDRSFQTWCFDANGGENE